MIPNLEAANLQAIHDCMSNFPQVNEVLIFNASHTDDNKSNEDINIALKGKNLDVNTQYDVQDWLENETMLPFFFDVVIYDYVENMALKRAIDEEGIVIFKRS